LQYGCTCRSRRTTTGSLQQSRWRSCLLSCNLVIGGSAIADEARKDAKAAYIGALSRLVDLSSLAGGRHGYDRAYESATEARRYIGKFISFYNSDRPHSSLRRLHFG